MMKKPKDMTDGGGQTSNRILGGTHIEGELSSDGDIRVDGSVKGQVTIKGKLVIGEKGSVEGEIKCSNATVAGKLQGQVEVAGLLSLQASAKVEGDVRTEKLSVEPGAEFSGSCNMGSKIRTMNDDQTESNHDQGQGKKASGA